MDSSQDDAVVQVPVSAWAEDSHVFLEQLRSLTPQQFSKGVVCAIVSRMMAGREKKKEAPNLSWKEIKGVWRPYSVTSCRILQK